MNKLAIRGGPSTGKVTVPAWPVHDQREIDAITQVVESGQWGIGGSKVKEFEERFAAFCQARYGTASVNGTVTLRLALEALGVGPGDEVIIPGLTFQATAASILDVNAIPILVDVDPDTYTIDPQAVESAITPRTKCLIPVHLYGRVADMDSIMAIAEKHSLFVLEDCAHQHGSEWDGRKVGTIGNIGSFSLQAYKTLNAGEGGVLTTNDERLYELLGSLRNIGLPLRPEAPSMQSGNYRMTEFQAAILLAQMTRLDGQIALREKNVRYLEDKIGRIEGLHVLYRHPKITRQTYFRWIFRYDSPAWEGVPVGKFMQALDAELENTARCSSTYAPLNNSILYKPHSKNTHRLSQAYWEAIDPKRFDLPLCRKAHAEEAVSYHHPVLLTDREGCDNIAGAMEKIRENIGELVEFSRQ